VILSTVNEFTKKMVNAQSMEVQELTDEDNKDE